MFRVGEVSALAGHTFIGHMLSSILHRRRTAPKPKEVNGPVVHSIEIEGKRAGELVMYARQKLMKFAKCEAQGLAWQHSPPGMIMYPNEAKIIKELGSFDGIGVLLNVASFDVSSSGHLSGRELERFILECHDLISGIQSAALNYTVLATLMFTLFVSLATSHAGTEAYQTLSADVANRMRVDGDASMYADFATWSWPNDSSAQVRVRRVLYCVECGTIAVGILACACGFCEALFLFMMSATALPSVISKMEVILRATEALANCLLTVTGSFDAVFMALVLIAARASAVLFIAVGTSLFLFLMLYANYLNSPVGGATKILRAQHREAQLLLLGKVGDSVAALIAADLPSPHPEEASLVTFVEKALPLRQESSQALARALRVEGFTVSGIIEAVAAGLDVVAVLAVPSLQHLLRPGDRLALAAAAVAEARLRPGTCSA